MPSKKIVCLGAGSCYFAQLLGDLAITEGLDRDRSGIRLSQTKLASRVLGKNVTKKGERSMGLKVGVCGVGSFGSHFVTLFQAHPLVDEVCVADLFPDRVAAIARRFGIARTFSSLGELCQSDVDAIAIFSQRWMHGPQAVKALKAGKHVYSAVPAAITLEELAELVETVKATGLIYMLGETSYYRPQTIYCRQRFAQGDFGRFVHGEGQYHHDMSHGFYEAYQRSGGTDWKRTASFPPMLYPTHSASHILSVTFARMTDVSCLGFVDDHDDGVFRADVSMWGNTFSNETALFRTSDGGMARINEFRRISAGESRMSILGTLGSYEEQTDSAIWTGLDREDKIDLSTLRNCDGVEITKENLGNLPRSYIGRKHLGVSYMTPVERLPKEFVGLPTGHAGSHQLLVVDFIEAVTSHKLPPNNVWLAARYNAPGIVAHKSAKRDGERMIIPDFGVPPDDWELLDPSTALK